MGAFLIPALLAGAQTALGGIQQISAGAQRRKAQRAFDKNKYQIPGGVKAMLSTIQGLASQRKLPGEDIYRQQLASTTAQGVESAERSAKSPSDVLGVLSKLYGRQMDAQENLALAGANQYQQNQLRLAQAFGTLGGYETEKWKYNTLYPYIQQMERAGQTAAAGTANIASGINSGLNLFGAKWQMDQMQNAYDQNLAGKFPTAGAASQPTMFSSFSTQRPMQSPWDATKPMQDYGFYSGEQEGYSNPTFTPYRY